MASIIFTRIFNIRLGGVTCGILNIPDHTSGNM